MAAASEFLAGAGLLGRGLRLMTSRRRLFLLGALPPLVTSVLFTVVLVLVLSQGLDLARWLTPFADAWDPDTAAVVRLLLGILLVVGAVLLMVLVFSSVTLALGSPIYDLISESVDRSLPGGPPASDEPVLRGLLRAVRQSLALIAVSAAGAVLFLLVGLVPVLGAVLAAGGSLAFGGWLLALELLTSPLERRGTLTIRGRQRVLKRDRARVLGLGAPTALLLSIPFLSVVVFPAATAAGTLLARQLLHEPT